MKMKPATASLTTWTSSSFSQSVISYHESCQPLPGKNNCHCYLLDNDSAKAVADEQNGARLSFSGCPFSNDGIEQLNSRRLKHLQRETSLI
jgi:hypothetical protein